VLLKQIAPDIVTSEIYNEILSQSDLTKRAEQLIEVAKKVLGPDQSLFVSADDIVTGNPRLNLAFTATLFNSHPALGPSDEELAAIESQKSSLIERAEVLVKEKAHLEQQLAQEKQAKETLTVQIAQVNQNLTEFKTQNAQLQATITKNQTEHQQTAETVTQQFQQSQAELQATKIEVQKAADNTNQLNQEIEKLKQRILELEKNIGQLQQELQDTKKKAMEDIAAKEATIEQNTKQHEENIQQIKQEHSVQIEQVIKEKEETVLNITNERQNTIQTIEVIKVQEIEKQRVEFSETVQKIVIEQATVVEQLKVADHEAFDKFRQESEAAYQKLQTEKQMELDKRQLFYEGETQRMKKSYEDKLEELRNALQKMQDMLPARNDKEGFLIKQGGGHKSWKKRWFVLKTNFMCYYKDAKKMTHPQGVIDLIDSKVRVVPEDIIKKKFCIEIHTPNRAYYLCAKSDEEASDWLKGIEGAKAKHKADIINRKTFANINAESKSRSNSAANSGEQQ